MRIEPRLLHGADLPRDHVLAHVVIGFDERTRRR